MENFDDEDCAWCCAGKEASAAGVEVTSVKARRVLAEEVDSASGAATVGQATRGDARLLTEWTAKGTPAPTGSGPTPSTRRVPDAHRRTLDDSLHVLLPEE